MNLKFTQNFFFFFYSNRRKETTEFEMKDRHTFGKETEHLCWVAVGRMENMYKNESWQKKHYNNNTDKTLIVPNQKSVFFFTTPIKRRVAAEFEMKDWQTFWKKKEHLCRVADGKKENVYKNESWPKKHYDNNTDRTLIVPHK